jgi:hypothetical protein
MAVAAPAVAAEKKHCNSSSNSSTNMGSVGEFNQFVMELSKLHF